MFFLLRAILVVGVIFAFSPVRQEGATTDLLTQVQSADAASLWQGLPETVKDAVKEKIAAQLSAQASLPVPTDTLKTQDLAPAWHGPAQSTKR